MPDMEKMTVGASVSPKLWERIRRAAFNEKQSISAWLRAVIEEKLAKGGKA